jgi:hypothetical protein
MSRCMRGGQWSPSVVVVLAVLGDLVGVDEKLRVRWLLFSVVVGFVVDIVA